MGEILQKEMVLANGVENSVENIVNNPDGELTASEQKIKAMMDKRAEYLCIDINKTGDKKYEIY